MPATTAWKDALVTTMSLECDAARHLFTKIPAGEASLAYRPSPGQRSTLELLRYLSFCGIGACRFAVDGAWDGYQEVARRAEAMPAAEFPSAMERQKREIAELLSRFNDQDLATRPSKNPPGQAMPLGQALLDMPVRWLGGYRMQLFLYAKALGADLWTPDCWYGVSMPRPAKRA